MVNAGTELLGVVPEEVAVVTKVVLVVPCYNEAERLDDAALLSLVESISDLSLVFVNDGSRDATEARLLALCSARPHTMELVSLPTNQGKAEAVRRGLLHALDGRGEVIGYFDADLSTPVTEIARVVKIANEGGSAVVMGSRVSRLGSSIERGAFRHYVGRIFASAASLLLRVRVYDTQCGVKLFQRTAALQAALNEPFLSRWAFDVELLGRLLIGSATVPGLPVEQFLEIPLLEWREVGGSKLGAGAMVRAGRDLFAIGADLRRRRSERVAVQ